MEGQYSSMGTVRRGRTVYIGTQSGTCPRFCLWLFFVIFLVALPYFFIAAEIEFRDRILAFNEAGSAGVMQCKSSAHDAIGEELMSCASHAGPVHIVSNEISSSVGDGSFGVVLDKALKLERYTEYCQWRETHYDKCEKCMRTKTKDGKQVTETYDCHCVRQYVYIKGWHNHRINSVLFNQPAAHYNPQRDPYPSTRWFSTDARLGDVDLDVGVLHNKHSSLRGSPRRVNWTHAAAREPQWYDSTWNKIVGLLPGWFVQFCDDTTRYEFVERLAHFQDTEAARNHRFIYVGQSSGYFFSPYAPELHGRLFKMFFEYLEGSLFDWQIGDLMPSCTAGDLRVSYRITDPQEISVIGKLEDGRARHKLSLFTTSRNYELGLAHAGVHESGEMFDVEVADQKRWCILMRLLMLVWAITPSYLVAAFCGKRLSSALEVAVGCVGIVGSILPVSWFLIWKQDFMGGSQDTAMLMLMLGSVPLYMHMLRKARPSNTSKYFAGGFQWLVAAWRDEDFGVYETEEAGREKKSN